MNDSSKGSHEERIYARRIYIYAVASLSHHLFLIRSSETFHGYVRAGPLS